MGFDGRGGYSCMLMVQTWQGGKGSGMPHCVAHLGIGEGRLRLRLRLKGRGGGRVRAAAAACPPLHAHAKHAPLYMHMLSMPPSTC